MTFKTDDLRSFLNAENGVASESRWKVELPQISGTPKPGGGEAGTYASADLNLVCTSVKMPGIDVVTLDRQIGMVPQKVGIGKTVNPVSMTFYLTNKYTARKYWQDWMECVVGSGAPYTAGFHNEYSKQVTIIQLDKLQGTVYKCMLIDAYPINLSEIDLTNQAATAAAEFTVTLQYTNYQAM